LVLLRPLELLPNGADAGFSAGINFIYFLFALVHIGRAWVLRGVLLAGADLFHASIGAGGAFFVSLHGLKHVGLSAYGARVSFIRSAHVAVGDAGSFRLHVEIFHPGHVHLHCVGVAREEHLVGAGL
jgi:hypothetical protein